MHRECFPEKGWKVLRELKEMLARRGAILAGGTALALHIGHRISIDLDFFTNKDFKVEQVISEIRKTGLSFSIIAEGDGYIIANIEDTKFSLFRYEYPFPDKPAVYKGIQVAGVFDIASMKVIAISQRGTKRDFVDLYFILQDIPFHKLAYDMVNRFGRERINPVHIGKSLVYFSDAESNPEPEYLKGKEVSWAKVKSFFRQHVRQFVFDLEAAVKGY
jgi:hypothetical protein